MARKTPTSVQLHKYKAFDLCLTRADIGLNPLNHEVFRANAGKSGLAHRLLNSFSVNDDCRPTDCQSQRWRRRRDRATSARRPEQSSGPFPKACSSLSLIERDRVVCGAKAELSWFCCGRRITHAREDGCSPYIGAARVAGACLNPFCEQGEL